MPRINLYIKDTADFNKIKSEVRFLWYKKFGESLSASSIVIKALIFLRDHLESSETTPSNDQENSNFNWIRK